MSAPVNFAFDDHLVRVVDQDGEPWFVAADVCSALCIKQASRAVERLDADEKGVTLTHTLGGPQKMQVISESGLYCLVMRSRAAVKPGTVPHRFRRWVTCEVLPSVRKTGQYAAPTSFRARLPGQADSLEQALSACREVRITWGRAAAQRYWTESDLLNLYNPEEDADDLSETPVRLFLQEKCRVTGNSSDWVLSRDLVDGVAELIFERGLRPMGRREIGNALKALSRVYVSPSGAARFWWGKRSTTGYLGIVML